MLSHARTRIRRLFHGTGVTRPAEIIEDQVGFDMRFCEGGLWGRGAYFAEDAAYSHSFAHRCTVAGGRARQMFLARVAVGRSYNSPPDNELRRPPPRHHSITGVGTVQSDSGRSVESRVFVLYETTTVAYPEYLITYGRRTNKCAPEPVSIK